MDKKKAKKGFLYPKEKEQNGVVLSKVHRHHTVHFELCFMDQGSGLGTPRAAQSTWATILAQARYLKSGPGNLERDVERRFSYALSREDIENAILGGP
ncbi:Uncharacterized protein TCM_015323 [Theobroma cacao]|uniref:Uncharacterized protein n=1 Tax=Theobroma cacao TaxID=3641 RepID=A0A061G2I1_THECC|nr:Uncharacterized protein TCM_015323 [Theobroma cacao]